MNALQWQASGLLTPMSDYSPRSLCTDEGITEYRSSLCGALGMQIPTPPASVPSSPPASTESAEALTVSSVFHPGAPVCSTQADTILTTFDNVCFYVHFDKLLRASDNAFSSVIPLPTGDGYQVAAVPEFSVVFDIAMHVIYEIPFSQYYGFDDLSAAVNALEKYGVSANRSVAPSTPLFHALSSHAPRIPLDIYSLASIYDLFDLAALSSKLLLSFDLSSLTDETARKIESTYLKRLFFLHLGRVDALKRLLAQPPASHSPERGCGVQEQMAMTRAWALAAASLIWDAKADITSSTVASAFLTLGDCISCELCQQLLKKRVNILMVQWAAVKSTI